VPHVEEDGDGDGDDLGGQVLLRYSNKWPHQDAQRVANALPLSGLDTSTPQPTHLSMYHLLTK